MRAQRFTAALLTALPLGLAAVGCGDAFDSIFGGEDPPGAGDDGGSSSGFFPGGDGGKKGPCVGLECKQVDCGGAPSTTISGKVFDPSGTVPLYNAIVYVPNAAVDPFVPGVTCDRCATAPSGKPVVSALTDAKGEFVLKDVPVSDNLPLVIQIGRWRRQITVPTVPRCADTKLDASQTRLPRNKAEGDIPQIGITTGGADSLECFLRRLGIDDAEFTNPTGNGRVHLYQGLNNEGGNQNGSRIDGSTPAAASLWGSAESLKKYDMLILSCEGSENNNTKPQPARQNLLDYMNAGGRVFASHFHYTWIKNGVQPLPTVANWTNNGNDPATAMKINTSFAKGDALAEWLVNVGASTTKGDIAMTELRRNVTSVNEAASTQWIYEPGAPTTKYFSFNNPIGKPAEEQCGRTVYTDIHVSGSNSAGGTFPGNCKSQPLSPQEKALLFLMMDLASCIQDDKKPPAPPPIVK
ncbi:MAG: carboxypeptidase regulatory-like domain-containing protein [Myxococcales bacterium]|jgi:hypothetical protein|nr:carboxypeptidase regulatory-like domain-containing protein [Myxococcales bacterium]